MLIFSPKENVFLKCPNLAFLSSCSLICGIVVVVVVVVEIAVNEISH
jgi:hypothetical protein